MGLTPKLPPFFVGYLEVPQALRPFLVAVGTVLAGTLTVAGLVIGATQDDPGDGAFRFDLGRQTVTGVIEPLGYPILHVTSGTGHVAAGRTLMMTRAGKSGVMASPDQFAGREVTASGVLLTRGRLEMLQLRGGEAGLAAAGGTASPPEPVALGRWRLAGEICDGKCLAGAMRPGRGIAHKACANLCLVGEIPPVFVSTRAVEGSEYLMVLGPDGGPLPDAAYDHVAQFISVEADLARHGDLLVMRIDPASIEVLP